MVDIYLITFLLFVAAPISIFLHELGHALAGVIFKAELVYLTIGRGKRVIEYSSGKLHFIIHAGYFMGGYANSERVTPFNRFERFIISIFGPFVNIVVFLSIWELQSHFRSDYLQLFALFNLWLVIINLVPFKLKNQKSDGYNILETIVRKDKLNS
ncbi:M50 family metallopeptidase [Oceanobacillus jordanicus]|uniref:M50 family metallopeptidase n=1 Tax=Oceanobacillus jordanicus TaxID=2867266 RepID=A0AAW5B5U5_9BACI|nr:M50 family metallopeptidase [Oceanobacillus jordanicus]MCG3418797.1 M50 family metallopeptidase [Oceanobacillus jordanicus]